MAQCAEISRQERHCAKPHWRRSVRSDMNLLKLALIKPMQTARCGACVKTFRLMRNIFTCSMGKTTTMKAVYIDG